MHAAPIAIYHGVDADALQLQHIDAGKAHILVRFTSRCAPRFHARPPRSRCSLRTNQPLPRQSASRSVSGQKDVAGRFRSNRLEPAPPARSQTGRPHFLPRSVITTLSGCLSSNARCRAPAMRADGSTSRQERMISCSHSGQSLLRARGGTGSCQSLFRMPDMLFGSPYGCLPVTIS